MAKCTVCGKTASKGKRLCDECRQKAIDILNETMLIVVEKQGEFIQKQEEEEE